MRKFIVLCLVLGTATLAACAAPTPTPTPIPPTAVPASATQDSVAAVKTYLLGKTSDLKIHSAALAAAGNAYYELAKGANFDYAALWANQHDATAKAILDARGAWKLASPTYEQ